MFLVPFIVLFLGACSSESEENYTQMLGAFERNDSELNTKLDETAKNISKESNRDKALQSINDDIIPSIGDFRQTINNYTLTDENHLEVQDAMTDYLDQVEDLMVLYSNLNEDFFFVNPLGDDSIDERLNTALDNISAQEKEMHEAKEKVNQLIGDNQAE
ncbi:hypothetical protein BN1048_01116 [Jeotgalicoccus saudimassiliensis]|uniref:Lipoprotein n=2 Tax=Jeotgalicoccus saudimassiliensis TaxID=1461582 RepID=A0A078M864_9STAP|nr:hypothetical protein BN1048_01116 [Jeotgalicoccus saudimassiliensis]